MSLRCAAHYGRREHRERLILLGAKKGVALPDYPVPLTNPADIRKHIPGLPVGPTCQDAFVGDLPDADRFPALIETDIVPNTAFGQASSYAKELRCQSGEAWHYGYRRDWNPEMLTVAARGQRHTEISRRRFTETQPGDVEPISRFSQLACSGLSNTLRAGTDGARGAFTSPRPIHYGYARCITVREMARLHGFPDWSSVPRPRKVARGAANRELSSAAARGAIAGQVMKALGVQPALPSEPVSLGDSALLYMEMSEAAEHFGVKALSGKRDRKSGARKRKQHEIEAARDLVRLIRG